MTRSLKRAPVVLSLLLPIVTFILIGRTVEVARDRINYDDEPGQEDTRSLIGRALVTSASQKLGIEEFSSAGAGISTSSPCLHA